MMVQTAIFLPNLTSQEKIIQIPIEVFNHIILHFRIKNYAVKTFGQITEIPTVL